MSFQFSFVQTRIAKKVLTLISEKANHEISIDKVRIAWLDRGELADVLIKDHRDDTLLYSKRITINYNLFDFLGGDYLSIEEILVENSEVNLIKYEADDQFNISYLLNSFKTDSSSSKSTAIRVDHIESTEVEVRLDDRNKVDLTNRTDFSNLDLTIIDLNLFDFNLKSDTISGNLQHFVGLDKLSALAVEQFETKFSVSNQALSLDDLKFRTKTSYVSDSVEFFYNGFDDFGYLMDSVSFIFHFNESYISQQDLLQIAGLDQVKSDISLDGIFWGTVGDFNIEDAHISLGSTFLKGGLSCFGLPDIKKTFILADIGGSRLDPSDLVPYIGDISENLRRMGKIDFKGSFIGFPHDFLAKGEFYTDKGSVHSNIHIEIPADPINMKYDGNLEFDNVNVGAFFENDIIQNVNLKTKIKGQGISLSTANFIVDTEIFESKLKGYQYDFIHINGAFAKNFFSGGIIIDDSNCKLKGDAKVDFRSEEELLELDLDVDSIFFDRLNLTSDTLFASGNIDLVVREFDFDSFQAGLQLDSALVRYEGKSIVLDSIQFESTYQPDQSRKVNLTMPGVSLNINGNFKMTDVVKDLPVMVDGYLTKLHFKTDTLQRQGSGARYKLNAKIDIDDISPYLDSLQIPLKIYNLKKFEGSFRQGKGSNFSVFFDSDSVRYEHSTFEFPKIEISGSLDKESNKVLTSFILESSAQSIEGIPGTNDLFLEGVWFGNTIDLSTEIAQPSSKTDLVLETAITLLRDSIEVHVEPSQITILDDRWKFNPSNKIVISDDHIEIRNFEIFDSSESIFLDGYISDSTSTVISISVEDLKMNKANLFTQTSLGGYLNGNFEIFKENVEESYRFDGGFFLKNLTYDEVLIGDLNGNSKWDPEQGSVFSEVSVSRENFKSIDVNGFYYPLRFSDQLAFDATFNDAQLVMAKPFLEGNFSDIKGTADGKISLSGEVSSPKTEGTITVKDASAKINYLNTTYKLNGDVIMATDRVDIDDLSILDRKGNRSVVSGAVTHKSFSNFNLDIKLDAQDFEFLNTTYLDNELYYGTAYGSGEVKITGPVSDLLIKADVKTEAGTRFFIPISESTDGSQKEFIEFVSFLDSAETKLAKEDFGLEGLTLDFDLDITTDAYCELIFDVKKGDIIRGRGRGNLKMNLDTDGEFNMFGNLEITEGNYNFTFSNLINKEFEVVPGGRISWYGDPYSGALSLDAQYLQRAALDGLQNPDERTGDLGTKIPFLAIIRLEGEMLAPAIEFDIQPQNEGDIQTDEGRTLLNQVINDEQELSKQFVSLLFLKKFSPIASFFSGGGTNLAGTVSEILSNQVSYLFSQIDENLEVELDLADLDQEAFNTFQLRLAYTFLDGRLKVTSGGNFGNPNSNEENAINEIVGDWSVEYSLTKDGKLRVKAFRNANQLIAAEQQSFERGVSLKFVDSFDRIRDILSIRRDAALRRREEESTLSAAGNYPDSVPR